MDKITSNVAGSLCPAMASADLMGDKWTLLILRELFLGASRFGDFQRAQPRMSPAILSKRLKMLEANDIVVKSSGVSATNYKLTRSGRELGPIIEGMAIWGMRWRSRHIVAQDCDLGGFMWDFHRTLNTQALPDGETVICVEIADRKQLNTWWLLANSRVVDLCTQDPGHEVDVYIHASLQSMISVWMGDVALAQATASEEFKLSANKRYLKNASEWFPKSPLADVRPA